MKISYGWLRDYVNTKVSPETVAGWLTMAGHEVSLIEQKSGDTVFDIEVTPNRPDCLSHIGIAREISAAARKPFRFVHAKPSRPRQEKKGFKIVRENKLLCPFYSMRILRDVKVSPSPKWLAKKISSIGLNPINNIVDITNFVLFETGHPLHAFDLDKLSGSEIIIRNAHAGESIVTVDNVGRKLTPDMLVIADRLKPVAIAGVMGGKDSAITSQTKNILLESAYFNPIAIRRTSRALGLSTDSSYRFERGTDRGNIVASLNRAASLVCDIAKADAGGFLESADRVQPPAVISLRVPYLNKILGTSLKPVEIRQILVRLGYRVKGSSAMEVVPPSYRGDTTREADLIEEVARIYGYDRIHAVPASIITTCQDDDLKDFLAKRNMAKEALVSSGFNEVVSYSLVSKDLLKDMLWADEGLIEIKNPLSKEQEIMRPSLLPGIIKAVAYNTSRQVYDIQLFELSNIYFKDNKQYREEPYLALALYSKAKTLNQKDISGQGFLQLKGAILNLAETLGVKNLKLEKTTSNTLCEGRSIAVLSGSGMLGSMGRLKDNIAAAFGITGSLFVAEINFRQLALSAYPERYYKSLPRFPYAYRDISFAIGALVEYKEIEALIKRISSHLVEEIVLLSEYRGEQIEKGKRSLAIRVIFRSKDKTLTEEEISSADAAIRSGIEKTFNAVLR